ncbi:MAG: polysaccharide biosynthesis tyrosine autokinase [Syntrophobacterales bacterium]|nr:polysaccharide biosynthesis tyrosine autokinase [Syntrophobacterales bacterium]
MAQYDLDLREYWRIVKRRKLIVLFTTIAMGFFSFVFAVIGSPTPLYKASAAVKFERFSPASNLLLFAYSPGDNMQTQMAIIKSYPIIQATAQELGLIPQDLTAEEIRNKTEYLGIINKLKGMVETEQEAQSSIINVHVTADDPRFAERLANTLVSVYKEQRTAELNKRTTESKKFVEEQLKIAKERLKNSEDAVRDYREKQKLISVDSTAGSLMAQLGSYKTAYEKAVVDYEKVQNVLRQLNRAETRPFTSKTSFYLDEAPPVYKSMNDRLIQLLMDRDSLLITYTENHPQVVEIKQRIHEVVQNMKSQLAAHSKSLRENIQFLKSKIDETERQVKSLPEKGLELTRLERNVKVDTEVYSLLEKSYQDALIKEAEKIEDVQIIRPAFEPTSPVNPPKTAATAGIGTLLGLVLGLVFAFMLETFDTSIGTIEEVEKFLGVPVLGIIPQINLKEIKSLLSQKAAGEVDDETAERASRLITHFVPKSTVAESYRALRTNLNFACRDRDIKAIVFTSATPREGKTTTTANLAIAIGQSGERVLLAEMDLRNPIIAHMFGIEKTPGLTDVMLGNLGWESSVKTIADMMMGRFSIDELLETPGIDNLSIIPCGTVPPNPAEFMNSKSTGDFIEWAKSNYDVLLMDAPPVLSAADAAILGSRADAIVIVYRVGKTSRATLRRAKAQLDHVQANVIGIVLNGIRADISSDFSDYDYKHYRYYGVEAKKKGLIDRLSARVEERVNHIKNVLRKKPLAPPEGTTTEGQEKSAAESAADDRKKSPKRIFGKYFVLAVAVALLAAGVAYNAGSLKLDFLGPVSSFFENFNLYEDKAPVGSVSVKKPLSRTDGDKPAQASRPETPSSEPANIAGIAAEDAGGTVTVPTEKEGDKSPIKAEAFYSIQVRAVNRPEEATDLVKSLSARGLDAFYQKINIENSGLWYRILIGRFADEGAARLYHDKNNIGESFPGCFIRRITVDNSVEKKDKGQRR